MARPHARCRPKARPSPTNAALNSLGDNFQTAVAGSTVFAGRHLAHGFGNPFDEPASYAVVLRPSGYEGYFAEVAAHRRRCGSARRRRRHPGPDG